MPNRRTFAVALGLVTFIVLMGCAGVGPASPYPTFDQVADDARQWAQADAALTRWANLLDASPQGFFLVGPVSVLPVGQWGNDSPKAAIMSGQLVAAGPVEGAAVENAVLRWADGTTAAIRGLSAAQTLALAAAHPSDCHGCHPLVVTGAQPTSTTIGTSRGDATVPAWEFTVQATAGRLVRAAVAEDDFTKMPDPPWDSAHPPGGVSIASATVSADGRGITAHFIGAERPSSQPCGADYTAVPVESDRAVVIMIFTRRHGGDEVCTLVGYSRSADAHLAAPLGQRAVLEVRTGRPVPVTRS